MSSTSTKKSNTPLSDIIDVVEGHGQTLTLYNVTVSREVIEPITNHFEVSTVTVRMGQTSNIHPENFAVLHEDEKFLGASGIEELSQALDPSGPFTDVESPYVEYPDLLNEVEQSVFTEYGKRRMILASRDIEKRAWRARPTDLHVGFQEFSRLRTQENLYRRLTDDITVHLYGVPDWEPPFENIQLHGYSTDELRDHWFVVYESSEETEEPGSRAILGQEREPNVYFGFWTTHRPVADRILDRLQTEYPVNSPFE